jgi:hypothetical protein
MKKNREKTKKTKKRRRRQLSVSLFHCGLA